MRWPWVSRLAYEETRAAFDTMAAARLATISERDWLRAELAKALDHNRRLERIAAKVHEVPVQPRPTRVPMPADVRDAIDAWESEDTRARLEADAWRRYERDGNWDDVKAALATD